MNTTTGTNTIAHDICVLLNSIFEMRSLRQKTIVLNSLKSSIKKKSCVAWSGEGFLILVYSNSSTEEVKQTVKQQHFFHLAYTDFHKPKEKF